MFGKLLRTCDKIMAREFGILTWPALLAGLGACLYCRSQILIHRSLRYRNSADGIESSAIRKQKLIE